MTPTTFPKIDLRVIKIKEDLLSLYSTGLFADTIRQALYNNTPVRDVCKMVMEQHKADPVDVEFVVGPELLTLIKSVYYAKQ